MLGSASDYCVVGMVIELCVVFVDKGNAVLGYARYYDSVALIRAILSTPKLVKLMDFSLRTTCASIVPRIHVLFSVDGAALNSSTGTVLGFIRVLNMVDYVDSPLMQYPILMAATSESRGFYSATLPTIFAGFDELKNDGVDVICVNGDCQISGRHFHR